MSVIRVGVLERLTTELNMRQYHTHEFGDSVLVSRTLNKLASCCRASDGPKQIWRTMVHC